MPRKVGCFEEALLAATSHPLPKVGLQLRPPKAQQGTLHRSGLTLGKGLMDGLDWMQRAEETISQAKSTKAESIAPCSSEAGVDWMQRSEPMEMKPTKAEVHTTHEVPVQTATLLVAAC